MPNVFRQRVVCFAPLRMVAGEPYKNTEIVSIQKSLLFSFHGVSPQELLMPLFRATQEAIAEV